MGWTYSGDPSASSLDEVRFLVGDTDTSDQLLQDAEAQYAITKYASLDTAATTGLTKFDGVAPAAVELCVYLASKYARLVDSSVDRVKAFYSQRAEGFRAQAERLKQDLLGAFAAPWAGNYDKTWQQSIPTNSSLVQSQFAIGMTDNPGTTNERLSDTDTFVEVVPD
ncbi:MAG: hypothetical protein KGL39_22695 [Patescibacteria group bacterium]|nr:hypothetical protein [Patescibacteria group bacterium]